MTCMDYFQVGIFFLLIFIYTICLNLNGNINVILWNKNSSLDFRNPVPRRYRESNNISDQRLLEDISIVKQSNEDTEVSQNLITSESDEDNSDDSDTEQSTTEAPLPECPPVPDNLQGKLRVNLTAPDWAELNTKFSEANIAAGGEFSPANCYSQHRVAIIIPFRDREEHLRIFLNNLYPFLMRQDIHYR